MTIPPETERGYPVTDERELLPCPHCGCEDVYVQNAGWKANTFVRCPGCKTTFSCNGVPGAHEDTVARWNRRMPPVHTEAAFQAAVAKGMFKGLSAPVSDLGITAIEAERMEK